MSLINIDIVKNVMRKNGSTQPSQQRQCKTRQGSGARASSRVKQKWKATLLCMALAYYYFSCNDKNHDLKKKQLVENFIKIFL